MVHVKNFIIATGRKKIISPYQGGASAGEQNILDLVVLAIIDFKHSPVPGISQIVHAAADSIQHFRLMKKPHFGSSAGNSVIATGSGDYLVYTIGIQPNICIQKNNEFRVKLPGSHIGGSGIPQIGGLSAYFHPGKILPYIFNASIG
jgi:hypothetical protein